MKQSLELRLGQRLTITPQLQQAIKLLQLSALDLTTEIQQALDENPLLEERDGEDEPGVGEQDNVTTENVGALSGNDEREAAPDDEASMVSADETVTVGEEPVPLILALHWGGPTWPFIGESLLIDLVEYNPRP